MQESENAAFASAVPGKPESVLLPKWAHLLCGWPLVLVAFGGAIGGGLGGAAYGVNLMIYKSHLPLAVKVALNLLTAAPRSCSGRSSPARFIQSTGNSLQISDRFL